MKEFSIVIPAYNEADSLSELVEKIAQACHNLPYEIIIVDHCSTDNTPDVLKSLCSKYPQVKPIHVPKKSGKADALRQGIEKATGEIVITMDSDLQDDPADIKNFLIAIDKGADLVVGWRQNRQDSKAKLFASKIYNKMMNLYSGKNFHDYNCGFKAFKKAKAASIPLYKNSHRFFTLNAIFRGLKTVEIPITNHPRKHGKSKYSPLKYFAFAFDVLVYLRKN